MNHSVPPPELELALNVLVSLLLSVASLATILPRRPVQATLVDLYPSMSPEVGHGARMYLPVINVKELLMRCHACMLAGDG